MFQHILIPTDGSDLSRKAVLYGVQLAKESGAKVTALTLTEPYRVASMDAVLVSVGEDEYEEELRRVSEQALEHVKTAAAAAGVPCDTVREVHDQPYRAIIDVAHAQGLRPDRDGLARTARRVGASARQRDRQGAHPLDHSGAGLSLDRIAPCPRLFAKTAIRVPLLGRIGRRSFGPVRALDPQERAVLDRDHPDLGAGRAVCAGGAPGAVAHLDAAVATHDRLVEKENLADHGVGAALRQRARLGRRTTRRPVGRSEEARRPPRRTGRSGSGSTSARRSPRSRRSPPRRRPR